MTDRPIIFSAPMVRALLDGRKTQTRRILKPQPPEWATFCQQPSMYNVEHRWVPSGLWRWSEPEQSPPRTLRAWPVDADGEHYWLKLRFEQGDRLWVRENCQAVEQPSGEDGVHFLADEAWLPIQGGSRGAADDWLTLYSYGKGRRRGAIVPSIHMPRWASRLTLVVTDVRVERLNAMSAADAIAEGIQDLCTPEHRDFGIPGLVNAQHPVRAFWLLWEHINGAGSWEANPWVAAISFTVHRANIDALRSEPLDIVGAA